MTVFPNLPENARARVGLAGAQCGAATLLRELWGWGDPTYNGPFQGPGLVLDGLSTERFFRKHHVVKGNQACALLGQDNTVVLLRQHFLPHTTAWQAWPAPLRMRGATTPSLLADRWAQWGFLDAFDELPHLARGWYDVAKGARTVSWWPLSDGWIHAPNRPAWGADLKSLLAAMAIVAHHHAQRVGYHTIPRCVLRVNAATVDMDGSVQPAEAGHTLRGHAPGHTGLHPFEGALARAMLNLIEALRAEVDDVWFLHNFLSHHADGSPKITSGTLASASFTTNQPPVSAHALLAALQSLPISAVEPLTALSA